MDDAAFERAVELYRPFLKQSEAWARQSCAPLWWDEPERESERERRKVGTVCIVQTGEGQFGITADHVHRQLVRRLESGATMRCQIGGHTFDPRNNLLDRDEMLDLATYELSDVVVSATRHYAHTPLVWPPAPATIGDVCFLGGHPYELASDKKAEASALTSAMQREHFFLTFLCRVSDCSSTAIHCEVDPNHTKSWSARALQPETLLDGMSGGPLIQIPDVAGLTTFALRGIVIRQGYGGIVARPLFCVRPDGTLAR
jgi:hypothetical protein